MKYGAGIVAARQFGAMEIIDPRPYAIGSIRSTYEKYTHLNGLLPAMGYGDRQCHELEETIKRVPCDLVLVATPIDLARTIKIDKPSLRVAYEAEDRGEHGLRDVVLQFTKKHKPALLEVMK
jgi:predicted GTPase